tara:strand:+ start:72 stop:662 length:591 start_codon:yes stop_codon:yes gene_type:complete
MSIRSRAAPPPTLAALSLSAPATPATPTAAHYKDVRRWPKTSPLAGLPTDVYGIAIKAGTRTDVITGPDEPLVKAMDRLLSKVHDRMRRHAPRRGTWITQGWWDGHSWNDPPTRRDAAKPVVFDERVGALNLRATLKFNDAAGKEWHKNSEDLVILKVTAVMDGSGQRKPWEVMLLMPTPVTIDALFPPVPNPDMV